MTAPKPKNLLHISLSDWLITTPAVCLGILIIVYIFYQDSVIYHRNLFESIIHLYRYFPLEVAAIYLWLKAIVYDISRIHQKIYMPPGFVYLMSGIQWMGIWMAYDLINNNPFARLNPSPGYEYFPIAHPLLFWGTVNILVNIINFLISPYIDTKSLTARIVFDTGFSVITFYIASLLSIIFQ